MRVLGIPVVVDVETTTADIDIQRTPAVKCLVPSLPPPLDKALGVEFYLGALQFNMKISTRTRHGVPK